MCYGHEEEEEEEVVVEEEEEEEEHLAVWTLVVRWKGRYMS